MKKIHYQTILGTAAAINLMLIALIIGQHFVSIQEAVPSIAGTSQPDLHIEYVQELAGTDVIPANQDESSSTGSWVVEHYKEYEYHYDKKGRLIEKRPTAKETHLRYWRDSK